MRDGEELTAVKGFFTSKQQNNNYFLMGEKYGRESLENWIFSASKYPLWLWIFYPLTLTQSVISNLHPISQLHHSWFFYTNK